MSECTQFYAYITKYALTEGIRRSLVEDCFSTSPQMVKEVGNDLALFQGKDWWRDPEAAKERAEAMRAAKIRSIEKQVDRLKALKFEIVEPSA